MCQAGVSDLKGRSLVEQEDDAHFNLRLLRTTAWGVNTFYQSGKHSEKMKPAPLFERGSFERIVSGSFQQAILNFSRSLRPGGGGMAPPLESAKRAWTAGWGLLDHVPGAAPPCSFVPASGADEAERHVGGSEPAAASGQKDKKGPMAAAPRQKDLSGLASAKRPRPTELHPVANPISWCSVLPDMPNLQLPPYGSSPRAQDFQGSIPPKPSPRQLSKYLTNYSVQVSIYHYLQILPNLG